MTDRATLEALLARVLDGEGPDRELDAEIEACLTGRVTHPRKPGWTFEKQDAEWKLARLAGSPFISRASHPAPPYTESLDAALTLVPEGWHSLIGARPDWPWVQMWEFPLPCRKVPTTNAPTIQRALIAACLKARMEAQPLSNP